MPESTERTWNVQVYRDNAPQGVVATLSDAELVEKIASIVNDGVDFDGEGAEAVHQVLLTCGKSIMSFHLVRDADEAEATPVPAKKAAPRKRASRAKVKPADEAVDAEVVEDSTPDAADEAPAETVDAEVVEDSTPEDAADEAKPKKDKKKKDKDKKKKKDKS